MGQLEELQNHRLGVMGNIEKSFGTGFDMNDELEKARSGVYADNAVNRKLNRVGQKYGSEKKPDEPKGGSKQPSKEEQQGSYQKMATEASDNALKRAAADENADPKVRKMAQDELQKRGGGKDEGGSSKKTDNGKKDTKGGEEKTDEGGFSSKTANAVESAFKELVNVYDDVTNDDGSMDEDAALDADEKFYDKLANLVNNEGLTEKDFRKIKDSNPTWKYGFDTDWEEVERKAKEYRKFETKKRNIIKNVLKDDESPEYWGNLTEFMDEKSEYFQDILKPYGAKKLYLLQPKLEQQYENDKQDPYGYKKYDEIFLKCLKQIPANEFKNFDERK